MVGGREREARSLPPRINNAVDTVGAASMTGMVMIGVVVVAVVIFIPLLLKSVFGGGGGGRRRRRYEDDD